MAYVINKFSGEQLVVLEDGTIDTSTSLGLVGRNYVGYGETQNENFVYLLENFANKNPPSRPLAGQIWFNTTDNLAYIYNGTTWAVVGAAVVSTTSPDSPSLGSLWVDSAANQLKIWTGSGWSFVGPEAAPGFGITRARSGLLTDAQGNDKPVIYLEIDNEIIGICTNEAFTINPSNSIPNFENNLIPGINLSSLAKVKGDLTGRAGSADKLTNARYINNVAFDGQTNITVKASTTNKLVKGLYLTGTDFDGSTEVTLGVDATPSNVIGKVVVRNSAGGFSAGTINATFVGDLTGNVTAESGTSRFNIIEANTFVGATLTGNAYSASQLANARKINGVNFDGTRDIVVPSDAGTLTGNTINSTVTMSSLTTLGTLTSLSVAEAGAIFGASGQLRIFVDGSTPTIRSTTGSLNFDMGPAGVEFSFVNASTSLSMGGPNAPAVIGDNTTNLGIVGHKFDKVYANEFKGNADTATLATTATNVAGGGLGSLLYQTAAGTTANLGLGADGYVLRARPGGPIWEALSTENLTEGSYLVFKNTVTNGDVTYFNSSVPVTISVDASTTNVANKVVARDNSGNFSAGTITANLTGSVSGNATTATRLQTPRTINGVEFDGSQNITVTANDPNKVSKTGDTMSGFLTLVGNPVSALHAATKQYVDQNSVNYVITYGNTVYSQAGYTNEVGSWNNGANFFDVFPPSGKSMGNLVAFIPSIAVIHYAGGVDGNDSLRCTWSNLGDRIRVYVQNTEQRSTPAANYLAIWS